MKNFHKIMAAISLISAIAIFLVYLYSGGLALLISIILGPIICLIWTVGSEDCRECKPFDNAFCPKCGLKSIEVSSSSEQKDVGDVTEFVIEETTTTIYHCTQCNTDWANSYTVETYRAPSYTR